jgi:hypothetical protein
MNSTRGSSIAGGIILVRFFIQKTTIMASNPNSNRSSEKRNNSPNKGETEPKVQKGAPSASNSKKVKHEKDDSPGAERNTTKKQENSI